MDARDQGYCPKCGMELLEFCYQTIRIDQCSSCDGIWLDKGELEAVERAKKGMLLSEELNTRWIQARERLRAATPGELAERQALSHQRCPRCHVELEEVQEHGVSVDRCTQCGGVWLDAGEINALAGVEHGILARLHRFLHGG
ncbi:zf-TFIIB domain-containing protein [Holophaga foetida]|uniref:TFIIB-type zinc ribbon-containing protein n=1 Tax=Holophaga foetida TaxID=35839 RepID=UPI0002473721|nr:zf-TFIIB domain-containing protein [Holophaga foetida]